MEISSERLAYWFLRLNGFMNLYNFVVHPEDQDQFGRFNQQTEVDVVGVRFPNRRENRLNPMQDHPLFQGDARLQVVLAETKANRCALNPSWREPGKENMQKVLSAIGVLRQDQVDIASAGLYEKGVWTDGATVSVRWLLFGEKPNGRLAAELPEMPQLTWDREVLPFIHRRFFEYRMEKQSHAQWDADAQGLFRTVLDAGYDLAKFVELVQIDPMANDRDGSLRQA